MLTRAQEKLIRSLHTKKYRIEHGKCLVEGEKIVHEIEPYIDFTFTRDDTELFEELVTTQTPQNIAAVAHIPVFSERDISKKKLIIVLDQVQDPGNVGSVLRLCLAFNAGLILVDSVDVTNPKVVRSSVGALFHVPWMAVKRTEAISFVSKFKRPVYRMEKTHSAEPLHTVHINKPLILIAGSEGQGIQQNYAGNSVYIEHSQKLESLNVSQALAIAMYHLSLQK